MIWAERHDESEATPGIVVNARHKQALLADLEALLLAGQGFSVATLNLDHVVKLRTSPAFHNAYARQTHVTADGNPIVWLSRLAGQDVSLVPGSELVEPMVEIAARHGLPVGFFGSSPEALDAAKTALQSRFPTLSITACISPPMGFDPASDAAGDLLDDLAASGARLCFLALGAPKQEILSVRALERMPQTGFLSIGAGLDFIAGHQTRAPRLVRAFAAEWLWRLASNPRRLAGRYAACIAILPGLFLKALRTRMRGANTA